MCDAEAKTFPLPERSTKSAPDDTYRGRNYRLCEAIDLSKLHQVTQEMVEAGAPARTVSYACCVINDTLAI